MDGQDRIRHFRGDRPQHYDGPVPRVAASPRSGTAGKLERIEQLHAYGLNTPRLLLVPVGSSFDSELVERLREAAGGEELMTVRTYHPTDDKTYAKGPFAPEIPVEDAIRLAEEFSRGWNVLFQEAIDVDETILAGNLRIDANGAGRYEALAGAYRVRDVEEPPAEAGDSIRREAFSSPDEILETWVRELAVRLLRSGLLDEVTSDSDEQIVVEFNVQQRPVGRLHEPLLLWEWRPTLSAGQPDPAVAPAGRVRAAERAYYGIGVDGVVRLVEGELDPGVLGGKGAGLARAASAGLPVPPAIALPAVSPNAQEGVPEAWLAQLPEALAALTESRAVSVRSSPTASMPGMLDTVLGVEPTPDAVGDALERVLRSWWSPRATAYRERAELASAGLAVVVQAMVFGDIDADSGTGVGFTRDPRTGMPTPLVEFLPGARGEELVGGRRTPPPAEELRAHWPVVWGAVEGWVPRLERAFGDVQEFELTVESGRAYLLQSRTAKRTAAARVRIAHDLVAEGLIGADEARRRIADVDLAGLVQRRLDSEGVRPLAEALVASPGVAAGRLALSRANIEALAASGDPIILATEITDPADYPALRLLAGLLTRHGGVTSHAAVAALEARVPALVGCGELTIDLEHGRASFERESIPEGEWISLEGRDRGLVYAGKLPERAPELSHGISEEVLKWAHDVQRM